MQKISNFFFKLDKVQVKKKYVFICFAAIFTFIFLNIIHGVGQYWDWSFPYFRDQFHNLFDNKSSSWTAADMGSPLGYSTDYFLRFFISRIPILPPEIIRYSLIVLIFSLGSLGVYTIARKRLGLIPSFLFGIVAMINPAIFYKYTAGHFNYLVAYVTFIYFVYFLFYKMKPRVKDGIIAGLLIALMSVQIQFFVICAIFTLIFVFFNRQKVSIRNLAPMAIIPLLISAVWLSNFISGANNISATSAAAAKVSVQGSTSTSFLNILTFHFSQATQLLKFYDFYELLLSAVLLVFLLWRLSKVRDRTSMSVTLLVFLVICLFMSTGLFQKIHIPIVRSLYPMLREVGHFAPIVMLTLVLLAARLFQTKRRWVSGVILSALGGVIIISGIRFINNSQKLDYGQIRSSFSEFKQFADEHNDGYRILAYPFFDQYSFNSEGKRTVEGLPTANSGHDSFAIFSNQTYIQNAIPPYKFKDSPQYRLLSSYNVDVLRPYGIKYIFDFSSVYTSNYEKYVPPMTYDNNVSLIKNDPRFFDKLIAANPGKLKQVSKHILEVIDPQASLSSSNDYYALSEPYTYTELDDFSKKALHSSVNFINPNLQASNNLVKITQLFNDDLSVRDNVVRQKVDMRTGNTATLFESSKQTSLSYSQSQNKLTIQSESPGSLAINGQKATGDNTRTTIWQAATAPGKSYFISFKGTNIRTSPDSSGYIGIGKPGDNIKIYRSTGQDLVGNGTFDQKLWQSNVGDCNNYDKNPKIYMKQSTSTFSSGRASLELGASRHNACTSLDLNIQGGRQYFLNYDYKSSNAQHATAVLSYGDDTKSVKDERTITDDNWHTSTRLIESPNYAKKAKLFLYAFEQSKSITTTNFYDNVSLIGTELSADVTLKEPKQPYNRISIPTDPKLDIQYKLDAQPIQNLVNNPSFERGNWQEKVSDCNQYDKRPEISMALDPTRGSNGKQSLKLSAKRHTACVNTKANIVGDTDYVISFDYRSDNADQFGYAASFNDQDATLVDGKEDATNDGKWHNFRTTVTAPNGSDILTLYLYAFQGLDHTNNVWYDNVRIEELPAVKGRFTLLQEPSHALQAPKVHYLSGASETTKRADIQSVKEPFIISLSETFNSKWQLHLLGSTRYVDTHFEISNYANGWYVDPEKLCSDTPTGCKKNIDGSYDIELVADFASQRWFNIGLAISVTTLIICVGYLGVTRLKIQRAKKPPVRSKLGKKVYRFRN